ncbi:MAG: SUMF1/EgtB/PvdO family nonheme iron enzyme, partial [Blastocatellia bacterium]|nr:SUMF1/EgtB/PvdO family nonheme iron enzyme [Blastocatellia bacterium]
KTTTRSKAPIFIGLGGLLIAVVIVVFIFYKKEPAEDPNKTPLSGNIGNGQTRENPAAESLLQMISIRGGTFTMGREPGIDELSGDKIKNNETPTNEVTVSDFSISKYEVTNSEYFEFVKATNHRPPKHWKNGTFEKGKEDFPVVNVSLDDVNAFCKWLSDKEKRTYRLPTEEEWEFAARGTDSLLYPWGSSWEPLRANTAELGKIMLSVKSDAMKKDTSPYGVIGMSGNVTEWTSSKYKLYKGNSSANSDSGNRVVRGSNFASPNYTAVTTTRFSIPSPEYLDVVLGFRVARDGSK